MQCTAARTTLLSAGEGLHHVDLAGRCDAVALPFAIEDRFSIDEDHDMLPKSAAIIQNITAKFHVFGKNSIEHFPDRRPADVMCWTINMLFQMRSEADVRHEVCVRERVQ